MGDTAGPSAITVSHIQPRKKWYVGDTLKLGIGTKMLVYGKEKQFFWLTSTHPT